MRSKTLPVDATGRLPRAGDLVNCSGCGRVGVHARVLALSDCCGRRVRVMERPPPRSRALDRVAGWLRVGVPERWLA